MVIRTRPYTAPPSGEGPRSQPWRAGAETWRKPAHLGNADGGECCLQVGEGGSSGTGVPQHASIPGWRSRHPGPPVPCRGSDPARPRLVAGPALVRGPVISFPRPPGRARDAGVAAVAGRKEVRLRRRPATGLPACWSRPEPAPHPSSTPPASGRGLTCSETPVTNPSLRAGQTEAQRAMGDLHPWPQPMHCGQNKARLQSTAWRAERAQNWPFCTARLRRTRHLSAARSRRSGCALARETGPATTILRRH